MSFFGCVVPKKEAADALDAAIAKDAPLAKTKVQIATVSKNNENIKIFLQKSFRQS